MADTGVGPGSLSPAHGGQTWRAFAHHLVVRQVMKKVRNHECLGHIHPGPRCPRDRPRGSTSIGGGGAGARTRKGACPRPGPPPPPRPSPGPRSSSVFLPLFLLSAPPSPAPH